MKNKLFALAFFCSFSLNVISQVEHTCEVVQLKKTEGQAQEKW